MNLRSTAQEGRIWLQRARNALQTRSEYRPFRELRKAFYVRLWQEAADAIGGRAEEMGWGFFRIWKGERFTFVRDAEVMLDSHLMLKIAGNKPLTQKLLAEAGAPVLPCTEFDLSSFERAEEALREAGGACVVKPAEAGAAGKGVTTGIGTGEQLRKAAFFAAAYSRTLLIEPQVEGKSYRLLFLNGRMIDAILREPPVVVGDGTSRIDELIRRENRLRVKNTWPPRALHPIVPDLDLETTLARSGMHRKSVPEAGRRVQLKTVVNQNSRQENHRVRDRVHPETEKLCEQLVRRFRIQLAGVDIICRDIALPLADSGGIINEINTTPGLHHHYLLSKEQEVVPVARMILESLFEGI